MAATTAIDDQIIEVAKEIGKLDARAKELRQEVSSLEHSRHAREMYQQSCEHRASVTGSNTPRGPGAMADGGALVANRNDPYVEEFVDELHKHISLTKLQLESHAASVDRRRHSMLSLERSRAQHDFLSKELEQLQQTAKWRPGSNTTRDCPIVLRDEASRTKKQLLDLYCDRSALERLLLQQTKDVESLSKDVQLYHSCDDALRELRTEVAVQEQQLCSMQEEIDGLHRLLKRKDKMFDTLKHKTEHKHVKELETSKRVTQAKLSGHKEQVRSNDIAIRHRAVVIAKLSQRLELIGDALTGEEGNHSERVDAEVVEGLRRETDILTKEHTENREKLSQLDADVEDLEHRAQTLTNAARIVDDEERRRKREHDKYLKLVEGQLDAQRLEAASYLESLREEIECLKEDGGSTTTGSAAAIKNRGRRSTS